MTSDPSCKGRDDNGYFYVTQSILANWITEASYSNCSKTRMCEGD